MTDFPTALTIVQRKADRDELWQTIRETAEACDMLPCRFTDGGWTRYTWTDGENRVIALRISDDGVEVLENGVLIFSRKMSSERTHIKPYLGVIYEDYKTIWNAIAASVGVTIDAGWFRCRRSRAGSTDFCPHMGP